MKDCNNYGKFATKLSILMSFVLCSSANKCLLKVATYLAQMEEYAKAVEIYEQVGSDFFLAHL